MQELDAHMGILYHGMGRLTICSHQPGNDMHGDVIFVVHLNTQGLKSAYASLSFEIRRFSPAKPGAPFEFLSCQPPPQAHRKYLAVRVSLNERGGYLGG